LTPLYAELTHYAVDPGRRKRAEVMTQVKTYRDLDTWQVGMTVVEETYRVTAKLPESERFGLCSQMRRAAVSVPSHVAESHGRGVSRGCLYFINVAIGSNAELDTQLEAARRLRFVPEDSARDLQISIDRVRQLLYGLRREKERQIAVPLGSIAFLFALGSTLLS
jgi:four helix bundle protein